MRKICLPLFTMIFLLAILLPGVTPVYAEYSADDLPSDPDIVKFTCLSQERYTGWAAMPEHCTTTTPDSLSIVANGGTDQGGHVMSGGEMLGLSMGSCVPFPDCINTHSLYYKVTANVTWYKQYGEGDQELDHLQILLRVEQKDVYSRISGTNIRLDEVTQCGTAGSTSGSCQVVSVGMLSNLSDDSASSILTVKLLGLTCTFCYTTYHSYTIEISALPLYDCDAAYTVPAEESYPIDQQIETPKGPDALTPDVPDEQIRETVVGQIYKIRTEGGPWNDGTTSRYDTAISWDGTTYTPTDHIDALCIVIDLAFPDRRTIYVLAESTSLYIRVNDTAGAFANNSGDIMLYTFGLAFLTADNIGCTSQFSYDPEVDIVASVTVPSDVDIGVDTGYADYSMAEWYAITVVSGTWQDTDLLPRIDMEFNPISSSETVFTTMGFSILTEGSSGVYCATANGTTFLQLSEDSLRLRVNDLTGDFSNNTGSLIVEVYHVTFNRALSACESLFANPIPLALQNIVIDAKKDGGVVFAAPEFNESLYDITGLSAWEIASLGGVPMVGLTPGNWYSMETLDGPWNYPGALHAGSSYDTAVSTDGGTTWTNLAEWDYPVCNVQIDGYGHRRVYFQIPSAGDELDPVLSNWLIRVDDTEAWTNNLGWMSVSLSAVTSLAANDCSAYTPAETSLMNGLILGTNSTGKNLLLTPGSMYQVVISTSTDDWYEELGETGDAYDAMQIKYSLDGDWINVESGTTASLCQETTDGNLSFVVRPTSTDGIYLRVGPSLSYDNNSGAEHYAIYETTGGPLADSQCFDAWQLHAVVPYEIFFPPLALGRSYADGELIYSATTVNNEGGVQAYPNAGDWNPLGDITIAPGLFPDESGSNPPNTSPDPEYTGGKYGIYEIEITNDSVWQDPETDTSSKEAQVSPDNGVTWYNMSDRTNPDMLCASEDVMGNWKIAVHVEPAQVWKIRIADTFSSTFDDDTGQMAYTVYSGSNDTYPQNPYPNNPDWNGTNDLPFGVSAGADYCSGAIPMPPDLLPDDYGVEDVVIAVLGIGSYVAAWMVFEGEMLVRYFSWCDRHTKMVLSMLDMIKSREPFATLDNINKIATTVAGDLAGYNWDSAGEDYSILGKSSGAFSSSMESYLLPPNDSGSPWGGGNLVNLDDTENPYSLTCSLAVADYLGPYLGQGMCFLTDILNKTGMMFFVQLLLDLATLFLVFSVMYNALMSTISILTGVNIPRILRGSGNDANNIPDIARNIDQLKNRNIS